MPTEITAFLKPEGVIPSLKASGKKQVLQLMAHKAAEITQLPEQEIANALTEREKLGTTGVGRGVGIPHARVKGVKEITGLFARLESPVDFESMDDIPVDIVFMLLIPEDSGAEHLKALAKVSRLLRDHGVCTKLRGCTSVEAMYIILSEGSVSNAA